MWWIIWGAVTILGFVLDKITSFYFAGFAMKYLGVAAVMVLVKHRTSAEHPAGAVQYTISLKYGLMFETRVSPRLHAVT